MLFHISEEADIQKFEPRSSEYTAEPVVWAIDTKRLRNYLLPRECPRETYYAVASTKRESKRTFASRVQRHRTPIAARD